MVKYRISSSHGCRTAYWMIPMITYNLWLWRLFGFGTVGLQEEDFPFPAPKFLHCSSNVLELISEPCLRGAPSLPVLNMQELVKPIMKLAEDVRQRDLDAGRPVRPPIILHVGANTFDDRWFYKVFLGALQKESQLPWKVVAVEPLDVFAPYVEKNMERLRGDGANETQVIWAAASGACTKETMRFSFIDPQLFRDYGVTDQYAKGLGTQEAVPRDVNMTAWIARAIGRFQYHMYVSNSRRTSAYVRSIANVSEYVAVREVPCYSPEDLLRLAGAEAADVMFMIVDAEGEDESIVEQFLELGSRPPFLMYEDLSIRDRPVVSRLRDAGYDIGFHCDRKLTEYSCQTAHVESGSVHVGDVVPKDIIGIRVPVRLFNQRDPRRWLPWGPRWLSAFL